MKKTNIKRLVYLVLLGSDFPMIDEREQCHFDDTLIGSHLSAKTKRKFIELIDLLPPDYKDRIVFKTTYEISRNVKKAICEKFGLSSFVLDKNKNMRDMDIIIGTTETDYDLASDKVRAIYKSLISACLNVDPIPIHCIKETCDGKLVERLTRLVIRKKPRRAISTLRQ